MSKISDLSLQIQELLSEGELPENIANQLNIPVSWVYQVEYDLLVEELS